MESWYDDLDVIGALPPEERLAKLGEIGELPPDDELAPPQTFGGLGSVFRRGARAWEHTAHTFGYIPAAVTGDGAVDIVHAGMVQADEALRGASIKVTLDRLRIADYPGGGMHTVLLDFYAQNQVSTGVEHLHFNAQFKGMEGEGVAVLGYPIFIGLNVGSDGVVFKCFTVNVANDDDEALLSFLDSDVFKTGLRLAKVAQPAIAPFSEMACALTRSVAKRNRNVPVQNLYLGLDFSGLPLRAALASGSDVAVQIPESLTSVWDWSDWVYLPNSGQLVRRSAPDELLPQNYLVFSVSRVEEQEQDG